MSESNLILSVSYRNNSIVINYSENMHFSNLNPKSEAFTYSYLNPKNYSIIFNNKQYFFPSTTVVYEYTNQNSVRLTLPENTIAGYKTLPSNFSIQAGYIARNSIYVIKSANNNIQNPCLTYTLTNSIENLSISNGSLEIVDANILRYTYKGKNGFSYINRNDFYIIINNTKISPLNVYIVNPKMLKFVFPGNTFINPFDFVQLYTVNHQYKETSSKDLYGYSIKQNSHSETSSGIKSFSLVSSTPETKVSDNSKSKFILLFNNDLAVFNKNDFKVSYKNTLYNINTYEIDMANKFVTFECSFYTDDIFTYDIFIYTFVSYNKIGTMDVYGNKIYSPNPFYIKVFALNSGALSLSYNTFKESNLTLEFSLSFNPGSLITDSNFDGTLVPWDGKPLYINPGNIKFSPTLGGNILSLNSNDNFGEVYIINKENYSFINTMEYNKETCILYYIDNNKISLVFNTNETINANGNAIEAIFYKGNNKLISTDEHFLYSSQLPMILNISNPYRILPINYSWQNPFIGGIYNNNYIIFLSQLQQWNTYGSDICPTFVNGNITFVVNDFESEINLVKVIANSTTYNY